MNKKRRVYFNLFKIRKAARLYILFCLLLLGCGCAFLLYKYNSEKNAVYITEKDENGLFCYEDYWFKAMEKYEEPYVHQMSKKLNSVYELYLKGNSKVYYSVIPDKSYFVENVFFTTEQYEEMLRILQEEVENMQYISIFEDLQLKDYYKTDHHWRQDRLFGVVKTLGKAMDFSIRKKDFTEVKVPSYQGVYYSYIKNPPEETFVYLKSKETEEALVQIYDQEERKGVYFTDKLSSEVPYDIFLSGLSPLITIENELATETRELILFGDSFASSLAPLLLPAYSKITLIDLRFVPASYLGEVFEFNDQEVLFLYGTSVINRSAMLR